MTTAGYKRPITLLPLEPYRTRYTEWLHAVEQASFEKEGYKVRSHFPMDKESTMLIKSGRVLDSINRPLWAMKQMAMLLSQGVDLGKVYFSDFFHPGLEALPYSGSSFEAYSFLWAQSFDCYDFTAPMWEWMRPWEIMALNIYTKVFVACEELKELIVTAVPHVEEKIIVTDGLPFDAAHVKSLMKFEDVVQETYDVAYCSRWDREKNPSIFLALVMSRPDLRFIVCTGDDELRGTDTESVRKAVEHANKRKTNLQIFTGLTKSRYYGILNSSRVQFNSASQDWVSFTLLEALTFGCKPLYPAHRSFPAVFSYDDRYLYRPFDAKAASDKLDALLATKESALNEELMSILARSDLVMKKIADEIGR